MQRFSKGVVFMGCAFLCGIWISGKNWPIIQSCIVISVVFIILYRKHAFLWLVPCVLSVYFGYWYLGNSYPGNNPGRIEYYAEEYLDFEGVISEEPDERIGATKLTIAVDKIFVDQGEKDVQGNVLISTGLYPKRNFGDRLKVLCKIQKPEAIEDFAYDNYLARYNIYAVCYRPKIQNIGRVSGIRERIFSSKKKLLQTINKKLPEPHAALMNGILIGARQGIPKEVNEDFNVVGITHIIAISGYNITIISVIAMKLLTRYFLKRQHALVMVIVVLSVFVIMTGVQASVLRAAIMGSLALLAQNSGRVGRIGNVLVFSALIMSLLNPKILVFDVGFQLSFLATIGLVYISPTLERLCKKIPNIFEIRTSLVGTLSATLPTLPITVLQFGRLSLIAPIVNVLVLPVIPIVMFLGAGILLTSMISDTAAIVCIWPSWLLLEYVVEVAHWFANMPYAAVEI